MEVIASLAGVELGPVTASGENDKRSPILGLYAVPATDSNIESPALARREQGMDAAQRCRYLILGQSREIRPDDLVTGVRSHSLFVTAPVNTLIKGG